MSLIKICNQYINNITWLNAKECSFKLNSNSVDTWQININSNLPVIDNFLSVMHPGEIERANRYLRANDKTKSIISHGALRYILGRYLNIPPKDIAFNISANKKPYIINTGNINLNYNISHSRDWILIAVSSLPIGADIEFINRSFSYNEVIDDNFSVDEASYIREKNAAERFFMLWTRKEALLKSTGKGLDEDLKLIPCLDGTHLIESSIISSSSDLLVSSFKFHDQYMASIASSSLTTVVKFWDINFL